MIQDAFSVSNVDSYAYPVKQIPQGHCFWDPKSLRSFSNKIGNFDDFVMNIAS
jgi:hypothetical protein